jgi:hypothetical protein
LGSDSSFIIPTQGDIMVRRAAWVLTAMTLYDLKGPDWSASRAGTIAPGREWKGKRSREGTARAWAFPRLTEDCHTFTQT